MTKTDVLVIGGGAAGITVALTAKQNYPEKDVTVVRKEQKALVPCGRRPEEDLHVISGRI